MINIKKILEEIIDYNKIASSNKNTQIFKIKNLNDLVYYIHRRNTNVDIEDIKAEIITEVINVIRNKKINIEEYNSNYNKFKNTLCRTIYNNICFKYKINNNMYGSLRYVDSLDKEEEDNTPLKHRIAQHNTNNHKELEEEIDYEELMQNNINNNKYIYSNDNIEYRQFIEFIITNKDNILTTNEIKLLNEMLYDTSKGNKCTIFGKETLNKLKEDLNGDIHLIHNRIHSLLKSIRNKYVYWYALYKIEGGEYYNALDILYPNLNAEIKEDSNIIEQLILLLEYKIYKKEYICHKYNLSSKNLAMKIYYIRKTLLKELQEQVV